MKCFLSTLRERNLKTQQSPVILVLWWNREQTQMCKLKFYVKPMKDPLGVSPSKGNQGTTRGKEKIILTSVGIELFLCDTHTCTTCKPIVKSLCCWDKIARYD